MAPFGHCGAHPLQPTTQLNGFSTTGFSAESSQPYVPCEQNSKHVRHPVHFSTSIVGYQGICSRGTL